MDSIPYGMQFLTMRCGFNFLFSFSSAVEFLWTPKQFRSSLKEIKDFYSREFLHRDRNKVWKIRVSSISLALLHPLACRFVNFWSEIFVMDLFFDCTMFLFGWEHCLLQSRFVNVNGGTFDALLELILTGVIGYYGNVNLVISVHFVMSSWCNV